MGYIRPGIKMPRLPNIVGRVTKRDEPRIVGLDNQSSFAPGYNPVTGFIETDFLLWEDGGFLLYEDEGKILIH
mgnify:CR=1 FL=1